MKSEFVEQLKTWRNLKLISEQNKQELYPTSQDIPKFYGLPKIHKPEYPLRPIVSSIGCITYAATKVLAKILGPLVGNTQHHTKNSIDFTQKLKGLSVPPPRKLVSFDVTALFTSIPTTKAIQVIHDRLYEDVTLKER